MAFNSTTGLEVAAQVVITSAFNGNGYHVQELSLSATSPDSTTYQISAQAEDMAGNVEVASPAIALTYWSQNPSVASVNSSGLVTAHAVGKTVIEVSYPTFANTLGDVPNFGWPYEKIWSEINVKVVL